MECNVSLDFLFFFSLKRGCDPRDSTQVGRRARKVERETHTSGKESPQNGKTNGVANQLSNPSCHLTRPIKHTSYLFSLIITETYLYLEMDEWISGNKYITQEINDDPPI